MVSEPESQAANERPTDPGSGRAGNPAVNLNTDIAGHWNLRRFGFAINRPRTRHAMISNIVFEQLFCRGSVQIMNDPVESEMETLFSLMLTASSSNQIIQSLASAIRTTTTQHTWQSTNNNNTRPPPVRFVRKNRVAFKPTKDSVGVHAASLQSHLMCQHQLSTVSCTEAACTHAMSDYDEMLDALMLFDDYPDGIPDPSPNMNIN